MHKVYVVNFNIKETYYDTDKGNIIHYVVVDENIKTILQNNEYELKCFNSDTNEEFIYHSKIVFISMVPECMLLSPGPFIKTMYITVPMNIKVKLKMLIKDWVEES